MPATTTEPKFNCSTCGKEYRWKPELAGKKAKCKCGNVIAVPTKSPAAAAAPAARPAPKAKPDAEVDFDGLYALAQEEKKATRAAVDESAGYRCPSCSAALPPGEAVCPNCRYDMRTGGRAVAMAGAGAPGLGAGAATGIMAAARGYASATPTARGATLPYAAGGRSAAGKVDEDVLYEGGKFRSLYLPLGLIVLGILFYFGQVAFANDKLSAGVMVLLVGGRILLDSTLIFLSMLIAVRGFDMGFGAFGPGILKIMAVAMAPGALGQMVEDMMGGELGAMMVGGLLTIVLYFTLIKVLFDLDLGETFLLVFLIYGVRRVLGTFLFVAITGMLSSGALSEDGAGAIGGGALAVMTAGEDAEDRPPPKRTMDPAEIAEDLDSSAQLTMRFVRGGTEPQMYLDGPPAHTFVGYDKAKSLEILKAIQAAGAKNVTIVGFSELTNADGQREQKADDVIVELPDDKPNRAKIFEIRADIMKTQGQKETMVQVEVGGGEDEKLKSEPLKDWGQKYLPIHFRDPTAKGWVDPRFKRMLEEDEAEGAEDGEDDEGEAMDEDGDAPATPPPADAAPAPTPPGGNDAAAPTPAPADAPF